MPFTNCTNNFPFNGVKSLFKHNAIDFSVSLKYLIDAEQIKKTGRFYLAYNKAKGLCILAPGNMK